MSSSPYMVHPNLEIRDSTADEGAIRKAGASSEPEDQEQQQQQQQPQGHDNPGSTCEQKIFPFNQLPYEIQAMIFRYLFSKEGTLVHALSRLDPFQLPDSFPSKEELEKSSGLLKRFWWGAKDCNITSAYKPNDVLKPLLVCKRWCFIGIHAFYGLNTFAFSSLGELAKFCKGIGKKRRQRIQYVELAWLGSLQYPTLPKVKGYKHGTSRRTWSLHWIGEMPRLNTLIVHIDETGEKVMRRSYEYDAHINYMAEKTAGKPNARRTRSLRTVQGMDYVYALRGMKRVSFYDYNMTRHYGMRKHIYDWSFTDDVNRQVLMPKLAAAKEEAAVFNLKPIFSRWRPPPQDMGLVAAWFEDPAPQTAASADGASTRNHGTHVGVNRDGGDEAQSLSSTGVSAPTPFYTSPRSSTAVAQISSDIVDGAEKEDFLVKEEPVSD